MSVKGGTAKLVVRDTSDWKQLSHLRVNMLERERHFTLRLGIIYINADSHDSNR